MPRLQTITPLYTIQEVCTQNGRVHRLSEQACWLKSLTVTATGKKYSLQPGRNVIGRKSSASEANIQIETGESRRMSRMHLVIEIVKVPGKGYVHQASLFKEKCNATYINSAQLEPGDCIVLHHCDVLRLPDVDLKFEIPEGDETDF